MKHELELFLYMMGLVPLEAPQTRIMDTWKLNDLMVDIIPIMNDNALVDQRLTTKEILKNSENLQDLLDMHIILSQKRCN